MVLYTGLLVLLEKRPHLSQEPPATPNDRGKDEAVRRGSASGPDAHHVDGGVVFQQLFLRFQFP